MRPGPKTLSPLLPLLMLAACPNPDVLNEPAPNPNSPTPTASASPSPTPALNAHCGEFNWSTFSDDGSWNNIWDLDACGFDRCDYPQDQVPSWESFIVDLSDAAPDSPNGDWAGGSLVTADDCKDSLLINNLSAPGTESHTLTILACVDDNGVLRVCADNPNGPTETIVDVRIGLTWLGDDLTGLTTTPR